MLTKNTIGTFRPPIGSSFRHIMYTLDGQTARRFGTCLHYIQIGLGLSRNFGFIKGYVITAAIFIICLRLLCTFLWTDGQTSVL